MGKKNIKASSDSDFEESDSQEIKSIPKIFSDEEINELLKAKQSFFAFVKSLGSEAETALSQANTKYSKEILQGHFGVSEIITLVNGRVDKMLKNKKIKKNWCREDCTILAWLLEKLTNGKHLRSPEKLVHMMIIKQSTYWETIGSLIPGTNAEECLFKWLSMKKTKLENHKWSESECKILEKIINENGTSDWKKISRILYHTNQVDDKKYRHPKQCREQWSCYLNPTIKKGPWNINEDYILLKKVEILGRKWSLIWSELPGRTENSLKNRYSFLINNQKKVSLVQDEQTILKDCLRLLEENSNQTSSNREETEVENSFKNVESIKTSPAIENIPSSIVSINNTEKVRIVECNYEQITRFIRMNHILIPAKIENDELFSFDEGSKKGIKIKCEEI